MCVWIEVCMCAVRKGQTIFGHNILDSRKPKCLTKKRKPKCKKTERQANLKESKARLIRLAEEHKFPFTT